jgi:predicted anti-sigma-YlaC factor YlaD
MTCERARELLELAFGAELADPELERHLETCPDCRAYRDELETLAWGLGRDVEFKLDEYEVGRVAALVDQSIARDSHTTIIPVNWLRRLTRVAAAVFIVAASLTAYRLGQQNGLTSVQTASVQADNAAVLGTADYADESLYLDEGMVNLLIQDYAPGGLLGTDQYLINDLSDEEMRYLENNFDVGELL